MAKAEYKSAIRSRKLIRTAFVELMQEKDTGKITVTDIVKRADINRGTFYAHYSDTHAVLEQIENDFLQQISEILNNFKFHDFVQNPYPVLQKLTTYLEKDIEFYRLLVNSKESTYFLYKLKEFFIEYIMKSFPLSESEKYNTSFLTAIHFYVGGIVVAYHDWFKDNLKISLTELAQMISCFIQKGCDIYLPS